MRYVLLQRIDWPKRGPLALLAVFAPYLHLLLAMTLPFLRWRRGDAARRLLLSGSLAYLGRSVAPRRRCIEPTPGVARVSVMSWNLLYCNPYRDAILSFLATGGADVIALQELTDDVVMRVNCDPTLKLRYPHRNLWAYGRGGGMGLLSRYPILELGELRRPPTIWARLDLGDGRTIIVVNAHPTFFPQRPVDDESTAEMGLVRELRHFLASRIFGYDPSYRDDGIARVRELIAPLLLQSDALLLMGDFNVTEREPGYRDLVANLQDVHRLVGSGPGHTWRPDFLSRFPIAILRIDYMLAGRGIRPLAMSVDRTPRGSDHCPIFGDFELAWPHESS